MGQDSGPDSPQRLSSKVQMKLGQVSLEQGKGDLDKAITHLEAVEVIISDWKAKLAKQKKKAEAPAAPAEPEVIPDPIEFSVNSTFMPEKGCKSKSKQGDVLKIHYVGKVAGTKKIFDSSFHTGSLPAKFVLGDSDNLEGMNKGLIDMCVGERRQIKMPPSMAYGKKGRKGVPPHSNVQYDVELTELSGSNRKRRDKDDL